MKITSGEKYTFHFTSSDEREKKENDWRDFFLSESLNPNVKKEGLGDGKGYWNAASYLDSSNLRTYISVS